MDAVVRPPLHNLNNIRDVGAPGDIRGDSALGYKDKRLGPGDGVTTHGRPRGVEIKPNRPILIIGNGVVLNGEVGGAPAFDSAMVLAYGIPGDGGI